MSGRRKGASRSHAADATHHIDREGCGRSRLLSGRAQRRLSPGQNTAEIFAKLRDEAIPALYPKFDMGNRPIRPDDVEKFLTAANLNGLPPLFYEEPEGLNLVIRQSGRAVPNLNAAICREVLEYLQREHSYGNKVTGKSLDTHFQGIGYAWERDVLRIVLVVLLRGGAIEVTHQGRKYQNHNDPACRQPFINNHAFRAASFAPREAIDLKMLTDAARHYEAMTGNEVDIEAGALAQAFQRIAAEDREMLLPLAEKMRAAQLPGTQSLIEFQETIEGILEMPTDDGVKTLAGEGKSYQEARARVHRLHNALTPQNLQLLRSARRILDGQSPILEAREPSDETTQAATELRQALASERFFEYLDVIGHATGLLRDRYHALYARFHAQRHVAYSSAIDEIRGLPEWAQVAAWVTSTDDPTAREERQHRLDAVLSRLAGKICETPTLAEDHDACITCRATIAQMESEIAAVDTLKSNAIRELQELAAPEKKTVRVRVSSILGSIIEKPDNPEEMEAFEQRLSERLDEFKEHLMKLLAEGSRIILE